MSEERIAETFYNFNASCENGNYHSAAFYLATLFYWLPYLDSRVRRQLEKQLDDVEISVDIIQAANQEVERLAIRIDSIISVGSIWDRDEIIYVLSIRIDIRILVLFLEKNDIKPQIDLSKIDNLLKAISTSTENKRAFQIAIKTIARNSELKGFDYMKVENFLSNDVG